MSHSPSTHASTFCVPRTSSSMRECASRWGPAKHAVQQTFFLYAFEPGGNRIEVITDGRLILAPDWPPVTWTLEERMRGQAWRNHDAGQLVHVCDAAANPG